MNAGAGPWEQAGKPVPGGPPVTGTTVTGMITVTKGTTVGKIGSYFQGFSVEKSHITNSSLTGTNTALINLFKLIGPVNVRLGANDVDRFSWAAGTAPATGVPAIASKLVGTAMVDQMNDFLTASQAQVIYGLNLKLANVANSVQEATYAGPKLGANLYAFEIGNEINNFGGWGGTNQTNWYAIAQGTLSAVPGAQFVGAAMTSGGGVSQNVSFASSAPGKFPGKIRALTQHYYMGPAGTGGLGVMQNLQCDIVGPACAAHPTVVVPPIDAAAKAANLPDGYRFGETNSFFNHGQAGLSDALIEALWAIDLEFALAQNGSSGINWHGGETGQDGNNPFKYEPIVELNGVVQGTQPCYDGMLAVYLMGQGNVLKTAVTTTNPNFTAYAVDYKADQSTMVMLDNKNGMQGVTATVDLGAPVTSASAIYLLSTTPNNLTAAASTVTVAGAGVDAQGKWNRQQPFTQTTSGNTVSVFVPPASAAIVRVQ